MNWRKLIYSIIIPSIAGFTFGIFISIGTLTNAIVFFYGIVMMIAAFLSSTGKGKYIPRRLKLCAMACADSFT